jgi:hypothetical protein
MFDPLRKHGALLTSIWTLLLLSAIAAGFEQRWALSFVALATLGLAIAPLFLARRFEITLPVPFVVAITVFLVASVFMGEAFDFYERVWWWDIALHGSSAIGFGLVGFLFVLMMFEGDRYAAPSWAICFLAFTLAVAVGTLWEIFEYAMDNAFGLNMQKSGLDDTMGDLIVDVVGAGFTSVLGYLYFFAKERSLLIWPLERFVALNKRLFRKWR